MKKLKSLLILIIMLWFHTLVLSTEHIIVDTDKSYSNQIFENYSSTSNGGVFNIQSSKTLTLSNVKLNNNYSTSGYGGAIYNYSGFLNVSNNCEFNYNIGKSEGGAIYNFYYSSKCTNTIIGDNTKFNNNSVIGSSLLSGGAIYNYSGSKIEIGNNVEFNSNNIITTNDYINVSGGAIYNYKSDNDGIIIIGKNPIFNSNKLETKNWLAYGGAIYNAGILTLQDGGQFKDNSIAGTIDSQGGAIYNSGTLNLIANTYDIEFTGNKSNGISNAIYNAGTINLWASKNADIIFNDRITSSEYGIGAILNINASTTTLTANGKVILNEDMSGYTGDVNLYGGQIELKSNGTFFNSKILNLSSGTLNLQNGKIDNITTKTFYSTGNSNLMIDMNLSNNTGDNFTVTDSANGQLNLTAINILGVNEKTGTITLFNNEKSPKLNILTTCVYGDYEYIFSTTTIMGVLAYKQTERTKMLKEYINATEPTIRSYSLSGKEPVTENLGELGGTQLTIFGNGYEVDGNNHKGIKVFAGQTLNLDKGIGENFVWKNFNSSEYYSGGVISNYSGYLTLNNINFFTNTTTSMAGGAIYNSGTLNINSSIFNRNDGRAIYSFRGIVYIYNSLFSDNKELDTGGAIFNYNDSQIIISSSIFDGNKAANTDTIYAQGGAIYNQGTIVIESSTFINNLTSSEGGAVTNRGETTILSGTKFISNVAHNGGAICNYGTLNLIANTYDIEFTGNKANGISNAIYNAETINLWASKNADIIFNDRITSSEYDIGAILNINASTTTLTANGKVILNEDMSGYTGDVNLYGGQIELKSNGTFFNSKILNLSSGTLNLQNGKIDNITTKTFYSTGNSNLMIDMNLSNNTGDNFTVTDSANGQLNLTAINILGVNEKTGTITLFNNEKSPYLYINLIASYGGYEYIFSTTTTRGVLNYKKGEEITFKNIINRTIPTIRSYSLAENELVTENLGELGGEQLTIFGNFKNITGNNIDGIYVGQDKILNIENVNSYSGFSSAYGAIKNEGTLNITETRFSNNQQQDIINNGSLFLDGICWFEKGIVGQGTTTIKGSVSILDNGKITNYININSNAELENHKTLVVNSGINNGLIDIERMLNTSNMTIAGNFVNNGTINQNNINIENNAKLETNASNINVTDYIINNGSLVFNGGTNGNEISGTGILTISNDFINNNKIKQESICLNNANLQQTENSNLQYNNLIVENSTINLANLILQENNFRNLTVKDNLNLFVDADLENKQMDTISASDYSGEGKINVKAINILSDARENKTAILFTSSTVLKDKITSINIASSDLYKYDVSYNENIGSFEFSLIQKSNPVIFESQIASAVGGTITQTAILNQAFTTVDNIRNRIIEARNKGLLYASTSDLLFEQPNRIESGLWIRPYAMQDNLKLNDMTVDNTATGTLAGLDLSVGENSLLSFYVGYAGSNQKYEEVKVNQTGYVLGATGMIIKEDYYLGLTANINFNKASAESDYGTDDFDMNMYSVGAKAGYNIDLGKKWILEPNLTLMYGNINAQEYQTKQGAKIDSQNTNNILIEPQVKAKLDLTDGWTPYALVGYMLNSGDKTKLVANNVSFEDMQISGYAEYGLGVSKSFKNSAWSCFAQITGKSGDRNGFEGNLGIKYSFLSSEEKSNIKQIKKLKKESKERIKQKEKVKSNIKYKSNSNKNNMDSSSYTNAKKYINTKNENIEIQKLEKELEQEIQELKKLENKKENLKKQNKNKKIVDKKNKSVVEEYEIKQQNVRKDFETEQKNLRDYFEEERRNLREQFSK